MSKRRERYKPKEFESMCNPDDVSANIYMSMLMSDNWKSLTKNQQILYIYCKAQLYAEKKKPKPVTTQLNEEDKTLVFTMNRCKYVNMYGIYTDGNRQSFKRDMDRLIELGFIELVEDNYNLRKKNIYKLSKNWRLKKV